MPMLTTLYQTKQLVSVVILFRVTSVCLRLSDVTLRTFSHRILNVSFRQILTNNSDDLKIRINKMLFTEIIKDNKSFSLCYRSKFVSCSSVVCYYRRNRLPYNRMGITAGKKIGNAVTRNRAKRLIRAAYRLCEKDFPIGYDLVFVAREKIIGKKTQDIMDFFSKRVIGEINKSANIALKKQGNNNK